ncbi:hypothetical protein [Nocardioides ferulae]|uniref:hypothetical protein n=1 Tax=Nocardioides ferulae TaxID=2340821 RepID=UPI000F8802BF|nr:hypothetical protein [Nocardioides ferulae]
MAAGLGGLLAASVSGLGSSGASATAEPSPPVAISVDFPASVEEVKVLARPDFASMRPGEIREPVELSGATADVVDGRVTVRIDPRDVPSTHVSDEGVVSFSIHGSSAEGPATWSTSAPVRAVVDDGAFVWIDPLAHPDEVSRAVAARLVSGPFARLDAVEEDRYKVAAIARRAQQAPQLPDCPAAWTGKFKDRAMTTSTTYPVGRDKAWASSSIINGSKAGIGMKAEGEWKQAGIEFAAGKESDDATNTAFKWPKKSIARSHRGTVRYYRYKLICPPSNKKYRAWIPVGTIAGFSTGRDLTRPLWNDERINCVRNDSGTFSRADSTGDNYSYGAAVKFAGVIGIDMYGEKSYSTTHTVKYKFRGTRWVCGDDDEPGTAGKFAPYKRLARG